jgi:hypothetical protein
MARTNELCEIWHADKANHAYKFCMNKNLKHGDGAQR